LNALPIARARRRVAAGSATEKRERAGGGGGGGWRGRGREGGKGEGEGEEMASRPCSHSTSARYMSMTPQSTAQYMLVVAEGTSNIRASASMFTAPPTYDARRIVEMARGGRSVWWITVEAKIEARDATKKDTYRLS
jgi:hypothetical protein